MVTADAAPDSGVGTERSYTLAAKGELTIVAGRLHADRAKPCYNKKNEGYSALRHGGICLLVVWVEESDGREWETPIFIPSWIGAMVKRLVRGVYGEGRGHRNVLLKQRPLRASIPSRDDKMALVHADI